MPNEHTGDGIQDQQSQQSPHPATPPEYQVAGETCGEAKGSEKCSKDDLARFEMRIRAAELWMIVLTAVMAFASICSVIVSVLQWKAMGSQLDEMRDASKQTDAMIALATDQTRATQKLAQIAGESLVEARQQFQRAQRPYVIPTIVPSTLASGKPISANVYLGNYGKSLAVGVRGGGTVFVGKDALEQADRWFMIEAPKLLATSGEMETFITPETAAVPGVSQFRTLSTGRVIGGNEFDALGRTSFSIVVVSREVYADVAGNTYWTDSCITRLSNGAIGNCPKNRKIN